jgi:uncharacterized protein (TIGR03790 family)
MRPLPLSAVALLLTAAPALALEPADVFILVNKNEPASQEVADHYCQKRGVPKENVVVLDLPTGEEVSRKDFNERLAGPLRDALKDRRDKAKVLLTVYGVPLRVGREEPTADDRAELEKLRPLIADYQGRLKGLQEEVAALEAKAKGGADPDAAKALPPRRGERDAVAAVLRPLEARRNYVSRAESEASVDSELSLLWWDAYELRRWQVNVLYFQVPEKARQQRPPVLMVARLDGPTPAVAKGLVDQAVEVEQKGLAGKVYLDARGIKYDSAQDTGHGYGGYDESLREAAKLLAEAAKMEVTLDDKPELFAPGSCTDCALYCGWYSLASYVDCCRFVPGAVAYHIASAEAVTLRDAKTKQWCKNLLEAGAAVTIGPVAEPYTVGFPKPAEFFGFLATGRYPLVECYYKSALFNSWMTVLVGDPLYNPFAKAPRLGPEQVRPSPKDGKFVIR